MFFANGVIVLRMPPRRGDLKGTVERNQGTFESQYIATLAGYVARTYTGLDPRYKKMRDRAKSKANLTVADYEAKLVEGVLEHNHAPHPDLRKPRISVWRDGQEQAPLVLPTGNLQLRTTFALTYEVKLTREGGALDQGDPVFHALERDATARGNVKTDQTRHGWNSIGRMGRYTSGKRW